jgi:hypothetical protein
VRNVISFLHRSSLPLLRSPRRSSEYRRPPSAARRPRSSREPARVRSQCDCPHASMLAAKRSLFCSEPSPIV